MEVTAPVTSPPPTAGNPPAAPSAPVVGSATVAWTPPTQNEDGSSLTDLAGYRIYYGTNSGNLNLVVDVDNPGLTRYVIENLAGGTWYFGIRAYTSRRTESVMSTIVSKTIR